MEKWTKWKVIAAIAGGLAIVGAVAVMQFVVNQSLCNALGC